MTGLNPRFVLRRLWQVAAACTVALAMAFAVPSPASAATEIFVNLGIYPTAPLLYEMKVDVHVPMSREDANGYLWNGAFIALDFYGDDPIYDDWLEPGTITFGINSPEIYVQDDGLHLSVRVPTICTHLDEDFGERDEIFVDAAFVAGDGSEQVSRTSNIVRREFSCFP